MGTARSQYRGRANDPLATCLRMDGLSRSLNLDHLRVVLVSTRNPLNIGAAARAMSNFGFLRLRVVNPYEKAFRTARSAVGAAELLSRAELFDSVAEAVSDCKLVVGTTAVGLRELQHPLKRLELGARLIRKRLARERVAILFGSERFGLSKQDLSYCHWLMRIPTRVEHISMNLGQAVAVCLYELIRDSKALAPSAVKQPLASAGQVNRVTATLLEALRESEYIHPGTDARIDEMTRRMILRFNLQEGDAEAWLGILRQILWKLRKKN
jgi:TrmH family RNA methyltransferase